MSTQKNKRYQFPHSLLAHLKTALGDRFTVLPKRVQKGYTTLLWNNQYITKANRHTKDSASWKTSAETLKLLFGDPQIFRDVNTNGFYMNPNRSSLKVKYKLCRKDDQDATYYPPTEWVKVTFVGYAATNGHKGVISGYQTSPEILKILEDWSEKAVLDESQPSGFDINIKDIETLAKKENPLENIDTLVRINMMSLFEYRFQLELIQEYLEGLNQKALHYGTEEWHKCKAYIEGTIGEQKGERGEGTDWGIVDLKPSLKPLQTLFLKDLTQNNNSQQLIQIKKIFTMLRELNFKGIPVTYELRSTGRYFATNATLQGYSKEVRYAALQSCYEYDLESAHQSILLQLLDQKGIDFPELEKLREYVDHKQVIREKYTDNVQKIYEKRRIIININSPHSHLDCVYTQVIFIPKDLDFFKNNDINCESLNEFVNEYFNSFKGQNIKAYIVGYANRKMQEVALNRDIFKVKNINAGTKSRTYANLLIKESKSPNSFIKKLNEFC